MAKSMFATSMIASLFLTSCASQADNTPINDAAPQADIATAERLSASAALTDIKLARSALEQIHPGYADYTSEAELSRAWAALEARASAGTSETALYLAMAEIVAQIRCDHTKIELDKASVSARETAPVYLPFRFRVFDGRMFVETPGASGLSKGDEILTIEGDPVSDRLRAVADYMSVDGFTDHVKWENVEGSSEELGSGFDHYDPLLNPDDENVTLTVRRLTGEVSTLTTPRLGYKDFRAMTGGARYRNFSDDGAITVKYPSADVAYLSVNTFVNYRTPIDPIEAFQPAFDAFAERGIKTLIVDNRENGGGSTDVQNALIAHLVNGYIKPVTDIGVRTIDVSEFKPHLSTWEQLALDPPREAFIDRENGWYSIRPELQDSLQGFEATPNSFDGKLILLTSHTNASGATQMTGVLRQRPNTVLVGEPTGGTQRGPNGGVIYYLTLPNTGFVVRIPWQRWRSNIEAPEYGLGFSPDIETPETYETWMSGEDVALEAALEIATQH